MSDKLVLTVRLLAYPILFLINGSLATGEQPPNFVIIYVDDLGWADTSVRMLNTHVDSASDFHQTPNLEKLASRGMKFSCAYAPAPTCTPSRKSIQFGKSPAQLKYTFVHDVLAIRNKLTWRDQLSLADVVKRSAHGYVTAHFGKGMGGEQMKTIGYDITDEFEKHAPNDNYHGEFKSLADRTPLPVDDPKRMASLHRRAVDFIHQNAGNQPFLMMLSHYAVHVPHAARKELIEKYRNLPRGKHCKDEDYLPENQLSKSQKIATWRLQYAAMVDEIDQGLGKIVAELERCKQLDNTLIVFTSDNGGGLTPNGPLRGGKATLYEGGLRVPFVVAGPGVKSGTQCDVPIVQWDLLPTLHDYVFDKKLPLDESEGGSLKNLFQHGNQGMIRRANPFLVFHYPCFFAPPLSVVRKGDYKLMVHLLSGKMKLFNLKKDFEEKNNLINSEPEIAQKLKHEMNSYLHDINAENIHDVYEARLTELDEFESMARSNFERTVQRAKGDRELLESANQKLNVQLERFKKNRKECKQQMQGTDF